MWAVPEGPAASRITVPLTHLKALFFVHEFDGRKETEIESRPSGDAHSGRTITVTFLDGEVLTGTTLTYSADGPGFFMRPDDSASNNERVFAVTGAIRHIQFA